MIKCRFAGTIIITAEISEKQKGLLPYEKIRENWANISKVLEECVREECGGQLDVSVAEVENTIERTAER